MRGERVRWVLAFNSGCARCRALSSSVHEACQGGLEILPLDHVDIQRWARQASPGRAIAWAPTLFRVGRGSVRMWTGRAMIARLALHLGPTASVRVMRALGTVDTPRPPATTTLVEPERTATTRRRFLELTAGAVMAGGIIITGAIPAAADPIDTWLKNNVQRLPRTYRELASLPLEYRSVVYPELTPAERSAAWVEHLSVHRLPTLTTEQSAVLDAALALAADPGNFAAGGPAAPAAAAIAGRGTAAFGSAAALAIFATLGPPGPRVPLSTLRPSSTLSARGTLSATTSAVAVAAACQCSTISVYCGGGHCQAGGCTPRSPGCGFLYQYTCNGHCV